VSRSAYLARTRGRGVGSNPADRSYYTSGRNTSSQNNNRTGQNNQNTGRIKDTKVEQERNEGSYLDTMMPGGNITYREMNEGRSRTAYEASKAKQEDLRKAIALVDTKKDNKGNVNLDNITDQQLEDIAKTGLFAMEASGDLGGTFGAEIEANKAKLRFQQTGDKTELERLGYDPGVINSMDPYITDPNNPNEVLRDKDGNPIPNPNFDSSLAYDPTGTLSFGDVESNPNLKFSYYGLQNKNASADQIRQFLPNVYGYSATRPGGIGGFGGGYGYGYGGGSGGGGGYGLNMNPGMQGQPKQRGQVGPGSLQEQVNQAFLSGGKPFAKGGIVSLVED
jgi:hypothetical protein